MKLFNLKSVGAALAAAAVLFVVRPAQAQAPLQLEDAATFAVSALGGANTVWFETGDTRIEKGRAVWRFTLTKNLTSRYQVRVDAFTGARIKVDFIGAANGSGPFVTIQQSAGIARSVVHGYVWKSELRTILGVTYWAVKVTGNDGRQYEVLINATTGQVRRVETRHGNDPNG